MRIDLRNLARQRLFQVQVDPADPPAMVRASDGSGPQVPLNWERALDDQGNLRRCPACGCRELFARKDFPQVTGFAIVVLAAAVAMALFGLGQPIWAFAVLGAVVLIDAAVFLFTGRCLVCYRCRSEFRELPIRRDHPTWELSTGEKYRPGNTPGAAPPAAPPAGDGPDAPDRAP